MKHLLYDDQPLSFVRLSVHRDPPNEGNVTGVLNVMFSTVTKSLFFLKFSHLASIKDVIYDDHFDPFYTGDS